MPEQFEISASVGRRSKGAVNNEADVRTVQTMLTEVATVLSDAQYNPHELGGTIDQDESNSKTVKAIEAFQRRLFAAPDGLIEVGKRTWRELVFVLDGTSGQPGEFFFPLKQLPPVNWTQHPRHFGADRDERAHAACDLYAPAGTLIHAIADGRVVRGPYYFYEGTYALEIDHGTFLARYGEVKQSTMVQEGDQVTAGQPIAKVGDLTNIVNSMLHLELYDKSQTGRLNQPAENSARRPDGKPFMRRKDLMDPTARLNVWKNNLPT